MEDLERDVNMNSEMLTFVHISREQGSTLLL